MMQNGSQHLDELIELARLGLIFTPQEKEKSRIH